MDGEDLPRRTVLVVDDDDACREALADILQAEGYQVSLARHGGEGLALLSSGPRPGLVLLDLLMPNTNGWEFLARACMNTTRGARSPWLCSPRRWRGRSQRAPGLSCENRWTWTHSFR